jgi:hypothetical protein
MANDATAMFTLSLRMILIAVIPGSCGMCEHWAPPFREEIPVRTDLPVSRASQLDRGYWGRETGSILRVTFL